MLANVKQIFHVFPQKVAFFLEPRKPAIMHTISFGVYEKILFEKNAQLGLTKHVGVYSRKRSLSGVGMIRVCKMRRDQLFLKSTSCCSSHTSDRTIRYMLPSLIVMALRPLGLFRQVIVSCNTSNVW